MIINLYKRLNQMYPGDTLRVGNVVEKPYEGLVIVRLAEGGLMQASSDQAWNIDQRVYIRQGKVVSSAPDLPFVEIEV